MYQLTPEQRDLVIRTLIGEAAGEPVAGQSAVAHVIFNRLNSGKYGDTIEDVLFARNQFEPWETRREELLREPTHSDAYRRAAVVTDAVMQGQADPTGGATHFFSEAMMNTRGGAPSWYTNTADNGSWQRFGGQVFGQADGPGTMREDRGTAYNNRMGAAAPEGLLDADPYEPETAATDWEGIGDMGLEILKKQKAKQDASMLQPAPAVVLQPLRRVTLKGLLG
jgi:hypothetical protein